MARFIETSDGWIFNTANVVKIGPERADPRGFRSRKVFLADGSTYEVSAGLVGEHIADPIIAAHPGWALVYRDETWLLPPERPHEAGRGAHHPDAGKGWGFSFPFLTRADATSIFAEGCPSSRPRTAQR